MYKKTIKYVDYNGNERTEDFYFNLTKVEVINLEINNRAGLLDKFKDMFSLGEDGQVKDLADKQAIWEFFCNLVDSSYGEKSPDGKRFVKSKEILEAFKQSPAYDEFIYSMFDAKEASSFVNGIIPQDLK